METLHSKFRAINHLYVRILCSVILTHSELHTEQHGIIHEKLVIFFEILYVDEIVAKMTNNSDTLTAN